MCFVIDSILDLIGDIYTTLLFIPCFDQDYGLIWGFPGGSDGKESACNVGDLGSIPGLGRCPGVGHGNPLQYPCLENPMDRGVWQVTVRGVTNIEVT